MALSDNQDPGMYMGSNIHYSTDNKPLCSYSQKLCKLRRKTGYAFCVRHILEDPTAPFRQCAYVVKSSQQKCTSAIPKSKEQEYCSAHMQVMGFMPKKERKMKAKIETSADDNSSLNCLGKTLTNGHTSDSSALIFSPSKLYPELAGKLSTDPGNPLPTNGSTHPDLSAPGSSINNATSAKSPVKNTTPKKRGKQTRKSVSILRKKQLGLLHEDQAKRLFTASSLSVYKHYGEEVLHNADIITPLLESSDDETLFSGLPPPARFSDCKIITCASYNSHDLNDSAQHDSNPVENEEVQRRRVGTHNLEESSPLSGLSGLTRLKEDIHLKGFNSSNGLQEEMAGHSVQQSSSSKASESVEHVNPDLIRLKQQCCQLTTAKQIYQPALTYTRMRAQLLIAAAKDNLHNAIQLVRQMRRAGTENCHHLKCYHTETAPELNQTIVKSPIMTGDQTRVHCKFRSRVRSQTPALVSIPVSCVHTEDDTKCSLPSLPLSNYCIQHITYDTSQKLFRSCTHSNGTELTCTRNTVDPIHLEALCSKHGRYEVDRPVDPGLVLRGPKKKKPKFALLRRKKRKNNIRPGTSKTAEAPPPLSTGLSAADSMPMPAVSTELPPEKEKSSVGGVSESSLISPLDKSLSIDENDMEILNKLPDNAFENLFTDRNGDLELTEEEQNLILGVGNEDGASLLPDGDELPDDITDVILHAESEQQRNAASFDHMYKGGPPAYNEHRTMFDQRQEFIIDYPSRPPPEYPGTTNKHLSVSIPSTVHHNYPIEHYHKQQRMIHPPIMQPTSLQSPPVMHPSNYSISPRHAPSQNFSLPPSASLLDSGHATTVRLPPVASIHRGVWSEQTIYQNGYHPDHYNAGMYSPGTMASPPIYHQPSTPNAMYPPNVYTNAPFPVTHPQTPHNHINMPLQ